MLIPVTVNRRQSLPGLCKLCFKGCNLRLKGIYLALQGRIRPAAAGLACKAG